MCDGKVGLLHQICSSVNGAGLFLPRFYKCSTSLLLKWRRLVKICHFQMNEWMLKWWLDSMCRGGVVNLVNCTVLYSMSRFFTRFSESSQFSCFELFLGRLHQKEYLNYIRTWQLNCLLWSLMTSFFIFI